MKISYVLSLVVIAFGVLGGMLSFMGDLSQSYDIAVPQNLSDQTEQYAKSLNVTAREFVDTASNEGGWVETAYNIFFKFPSSVYSTMTTSVATVNSFFGIMVSESQAVIPNWFVVVIGLTLAITFSVGAIYFIFGRAI